MLGAVRPHSLLVAIMFLTSCANPTKGGVAEGSTDGTQPGNAAECESTIEAFDCGGADLQMYIPCQGLA